MELGFRHTFQEVTFTRPSICTGVFTGRTSTLFLLLHTLLEGILINGHIVFGSNLFCQVNGKAVGIAKLKGIVTGNDLILILRNDVVQQLRALVNRAGKAFFFYGNQLQNHGFLFFQLRISTLIFVDDRLGNLCEERFMNTKQTPVASRTTQQTAQHVAAALIAGHNAVTYHKGCRTCMVGNDA